MFHKLSVTPDSSKWRMLRLQDTAQPRQINLFPVMLIFVLDLRPSQEQAWVTSRTNWLLVANLVWLCLFGWSILFSYWKEDEVKTLKDTLPIRAFSGTTSERCHRDWTRNKSGLLQEYEALSNHWELPNLPSDLSCGSLLSMRKIHCQKCWYQVNHLCCYIANNGFE